MGKQQNKMNPPSELKISAKFSSKWCFEMGKVVILATFDISIFIFLGIDALLLDFTLIFSSHYRCVFKCIVEDICPHLDVKLVKGTYHEQWSRESPR